MAGDATRAAKIEALDTILMTSGSPFLALCTSPPSANALGTEYAATGYARQAVTWNAVTNADPPVATSSGALTFGPFTAGTGATITHVALMDAVSGGTAAHMRAFWELDEPVTPATSDTFDLVDGELQFQTDPPG